MKILFLIIDMQYDFCDPSGTLYVPGAKNDVKRVAKLIRLRMKEIANIIMTQDNHQVMDISHPAFWKNEEGEHPEPFTVITYQDVREKKWSPVLYAEQAEKYLHDAEEAGEYPHTIWPEHCIWGSMGAAIVPPVMDAVTLWCKQGKMLEIVEKGRHPLTEHFGALRANVPLSVAEETKMNLKLVQRLRLYDRIWIAGEAKSHCVANTLKQLFDFPEIMKKIVILEDCMSSVPGFEDLGTAIFDQAQMMGARIKNSIELIN